MIKDISTARELTERIKKHLLSEGVEWQKSFSDGFTLGDPATAVRGIAVTFKPTMSVLKQAAARGLNFVISHEATFWEAFDPPYVMTADPTRQAKIAFAQENGLVVWRLHDHMHRMQPEPIFTELIRKLEWMPYFQWEQGIHRIEIPQIRLDELAIHVQTNLETSNVSVIGDPAMPVRTVGFGVHTLSTVLPALHASDVAIVGETAEYDTYEYVRDAIALGHKKGLIRIAHERLEAWGVAGFADWLRPVTPGIRLESLLTGDPFTVPRRI